MKKEDMSSWKPTEQSKYAVAIYNFEGKVVCGLQLAVGDTVQIYEECAEWYRGCLLRNKSQKGIFPRSYVYLKECDVENTGTPYEVVIPKEDPSVKELTSVLREWAVIWKQLYMKNNMQLFVALRKIMWDLIEFRQQLLSGTLSQDQMFEIKQKAINDIDWANSKMGLDLIPRINGEVLDADSTSVVELYNVHVESAKASESALGRGTIKKAKKQQQVKTLISNHLYFNINSFVCKVEESCQIFFSIYDASKSKFISERFMVTIGKSDSNQKVNQLQNISNSTCVFTDLGENDLHSNCYLVAQIIRVGKMLVDSSSRKVSNMSYRRPYGCAVIDIVDILKEKEENVVNKELYMSIQLLSGSNETDFVSMHENTIKKLQSKYGAPESDMNIYVSMRMLHGELEKLHRENPLLLPRGTAIVRKLGFPEIIMPGDVRNDVYVTIESGEFERGPGKTSQKNVEVSMCVVGSNGRLIEDCIFLGGDSVPCTEYQSTIYYHNGSPKWNETIKVQVPLGKFYGSILRFGFRHLSKFKDNDRDSKTFAFSFLKLMREDGTTINDGLHELCLYKFEKNTFYDSKAYINMASTQSEVGSIKNSATDRVARCAKETFFVRTVVCSTKLTQNVDLVGLLRWREQKHQLQSVLQSLVKIDGEEIVKFLQDIFDALFWILNESIEEYGNLVFQAMVFIIWILSNKKYQHFQAVLTTYIEKHFSGTIAHKKLVSCLKQVLEQTGDATSIERLKKTITALEYIFKFIIQSRVLFISTFGNKEEEVFRRELRSLFLALNNLMSQQTGELTQAQDLALRHFAGIYDDALKVFSRTELGDIVKDFVNSVGKDARSKALICPKLQCIVQTVHSQLFVHEDSRKVLLPMIVSHIHFHLSQKQEMKTCAEILGPVLTALQTKAVGDKEEDVFLVAKSLLQTVFLTVKTVDRAGKLSRHLLAILINLLRIMTEDHYSRFLQQFDGRKEMKDFLFNAFVVFTEMIRRQSFPRDWVVIIMLANNVILTALQSLSVALMDNFCEENFDFQLWNSYFQLSVAFLIQPHLQLENFTEVKRNKIVDRYGDMRQVMGFELRDMWQNLGEHKKHFIPSLIGPFLEVTMIPQTELRKATLPIFFDMIENELLSKGFIQTVENEMVNKLDKLVSFNRKGSKLEDDGQNRKTINNHEMKGDEKYKELFHQILTEKVEAELQEDFKEEGLGFVNRVTDLLELLLDYRSCISDDNAIRRLSCIVKLLEFYRGIEREDMYIRYINRLCELHIPAENFTEAGFTLLLHADLLTWIERPIDATKSSITERQLKEKLYLDAIDYFDKGKCWEKGIELCKELAELYETEVYDFVRLSNILKTEAIFYDNIMSKVRPEPEYFMIGMYGKGFSPSLRNKVFVFRGKEFEKITDFKSRMQAQFPDAQFMDKLTPPDDSILQSLGQYFQTCQVNPICEYDDLFKEGSVDEQITSYYRVNDVKRFTYDRPFHRGVVIKFNEFANLWLERTTMKISSPLPGILKWFPVISTSTEEISPIRNAVETVEKKNQQMRSLISRLSSEPNQNINPLSMTLNGVIDAAVMGGTAKYKEAFFTPGYILSNPEDQVYVNILDDAIIKQVYILEEGLDLHHRLLTKVLIPFHEKMAYQFARMKADVTGEPYEEPKPIQLITPSIPEDSPMKSKDRKLSLPLRKSSSRSTVSEGSGDSLRDSPRDSRQSSWYDSSSPSTPSPSSVVQRKSFGSMTSLASTLSRVSMSSLGSSMTSLTGSIASLDTLREVDEEAPPPIPEKFTRPPSDPMVGQRSLKSTPLIHGRNSLPAAMMSYRMDQDENGADVSPVLPKKQRSASSILTTDNEKLPDAPPPLPPRQSIAIDSTSSTYSSSDDDTDTPLASPVPDLPPKNRNSSYFSDNPENEVTPSNVTTDDPYKFPIALPKKHTSPLSSSQGFSPSSLQDLPLNLNATYPPSDPVVLRRNNYDKVISPVSDEGSLFSPTSSESSRASIASPEGSLTPGSSDFSPATSTLTRSTKFVYDDIESSDPQNQKPDLMNFSPEEDLMPTQASKSSVSKNLSNSFENSQNPVSSSESEEDFWSLTGNTNNNWENFGNDFPEPFSFPSSSSLKSWSVSSSTTVTKTKVVNGKTISSSSSETSYDSSRGPSTTRPSSVMISSILSNPHQSAMISELESVMGERRMTMPERMFKPTPMPRKIGLDKKSTSTPALSRSDGKPGNGQEEEKPTRPLVKPRHIVGLKSQESPPPRPPKPYTVKPKERAPNKLFSVKSQQETKKNES